GGGVGGVASACRGGVGRGGAGSDFAASAGGGAGAGLIVDGAGGGAVSATAAATGVGSAACGSAAAAGTAGATAATGLGAGDATCNGAGAALFVPTLTATVLTSTGWIGSVEPMTGGACVSVATGSGCAPSDDAPAELKRAGTLIALATANRGSTFAFGCAVASVLAATSGFGSAFATTFGSAFGSALVTTIGSGLRSGLIATTGWGAGSVASATMVAVRLTDASAIFSLISSRMRASRLAPLLPPMTTATRSRLPRWTGGPDVQTAEPQDA